eukprot:1170894-Rhodomonas_salina.4
MECALRVCGQRLLRLSQAQAQRRIAASTGLFGAATDLSRSMFGTNRAAVFAWPLDPSAP